MACKACVKEKLAAIIKNVGSLFSYSCNNWTDTLTGVVSIRFDDDAQNELFEDAVKIMNEKCKECPGE